MKTTLTLITLAIVASGCVRKSEYENALLQIKEKETALVTITAKQEEAAQQILILQKKLADSEAMAKEIAERAQKEIARASAISAAKAESDIARAANELESIKAQLKKEKHRNETLEEALKKLGVQLSTSARELRKLSSAFEEGISVPDFESLHRSVKIAIEQALDSGPNSRITEAINQALGTYTELRKLFDERSQAVERATEKADIELRKYAAGYYTTAFTIGLERDRLSEQIQAVHDSFNQKVQTLIARGSKQAKEIKDLSDKMNSTIESLHGS